MIRGPLGLARPKARTKLVVDPQKGKVYARRVGPFGGPRPFTIFNEEVPDEDVAECVRSRAAQDFARGVSGNQGMEDLGDVAEATEAWCRGILESTREESDEPFFQLQTPELVGD